MRANTADESTKGRERAAENKEAKNVRIADSDLAVAVQLPRVGLGAHVTIVRITKSFSDGRPSGRTLQYMKTRRGKEFACNMKGETLFHNADKPFLRFGPARHTVIAFWKAIQHCILKHSIKMILTGHSTPRLGCAAAALERRRKAPLPRSSGDGTSAAGAGSAGPPPAAARSRGFAGASQPGLARAARSTVLG